MTRATVALLPLTLVALTSCGSGEDAASSTVRAVTTADESIDPRGTTTSQPAPPGPGGPAGSETPASTEPPPTVSGGSAAGSTVTPSRDVARAVADLVERAGIAAEDVTVVSSENVTWRDSSLGCPREGMQYLQVLTDGVRIVLEAGGQRYEYHGGGRRSIFYCATPEPPVGE